MARWLRSIGTVDRFQIGMVADIMSEWWPDEIGIRAATDYRRNRLFALAAASAGPKNAGLAPPFAVVAIDAAEAGGLVELIVAGMTIRIGAT